jgi:2-polyprenyl-6-methoxyphenol hydroxylase-like FAD-dependent oxidoreductase
MIMQGIQRQIREAPFMRIAIVGAGALGLYYGALLQRSGEDVRFLLHRDYDAVTGYGLRIFSVKGDFTLPHVRRAWPAAGNRDAARGDAGDVAGAGHALND